MYVQLNYEHSLVDCHQEEGEYGSWGKTYTFDGPTHGKLSADYGEPILDSAQPGQTFYAVIAVWSSGDSFGCAESGSMDVISVYPTLQQAESVVEKLSAHTARYSSDQWNYEYRCDIETPDGQPYRYYVPWLGYFETLEVLEVFPIILE